MGRLVVATISGMQWLSRRLFCKRLLYASSPRLFITTKDNKLHSGIAYATDPGVVAMQKSFLKKYADCDHEKIWNLSTDIGEIAFEGFVPDFFYLCGVEECHHAIFSQYKGNQNSSNHSLSIAKYDADEIEFRALKWQLRAARERIMPLCTVDRLRHRVEEARQIRKESVLL